MVIGTAAPPTAGVAAPPELDRRVQAFLDARRPEWGRGVNYWNIRYEDGPRLHEPVVACGFKRLLEAGTSTGHSAIWLAWAAAKTGGRLVTIESRQRAAGLCAAGHGVRAHRTVGRRVRHAHRGPGQRRRAGGHGGPNDSSSEV